MPRDSWRGARIFPLQSSSSQPALTAGLFLTPGIPSPCLESLRQASVCAWNPIATPRFVPVESPLPHSHRSPLKHPEKAAPNNGRPPPPPPPPPRAGVDSRVRPVHDRPRLLPPDDGGAAGDQGDGGALHPVRHPLALRRHRVVSKPCRLLPCMPLCCGAWVQAAASWRVRRPHACLSPSPPRSRPRYWSTHPPVSCRPSSGCRVTVHKRFYRPHECLSLISAADIDNREAAALGAATEVRALARPALACLPACLRHRRRRSRSDDDAGFPASPLCFRHATHARSHPCACHLCSSPPASRRPLWTKRSTAATSPPPSSSSERRWGDTLVYNFGRRAFCARVCVCVCVGGWVWGGVGGKGGSSPSLAPALRLSARLDTCCVLPSLSAPLQRARPRAGALRGGAHAGA